MSDEKWSDEGKELVKSINRLEADLSNRIENLEDKLEIYGAMFRTDPGQKAARQVRRFYEVLEYAEKQRSSAAPNQEGVSLTPNEIAAATDITRSHAYNVIDDICDWDPATCEKKDGDSPLKLRVKWNGTTKRARRQLDKIREVTAE